MNVDEENSNGRRRRSVTNSVRAQSENPKPSTKSAWDFDPGAYIANLFKRFRARLDLKNKVERIVAGIGPRRLIIILALAWLVCVACGGWGKTKEEFLDKDHDLIYEQWVSERNVAEGVGVLGMVGATVLLVLILFVQFKFVKSKLVTWILIAVPVASFITGSIGMNLAEEWSHSYETVGRVPTLNLINNLLMAVMMPYCLLILPFVALFVSAASAVKGILQSIFGRR